MKKAIISSLILTTFSTSSYAFFGAKKDFKFDFDKGLCLNEKNEIGFNKGLIGECGDLREVSRRKLEKSQLYKISLKAANLQGVDLSNLDMEGTNFYSSDLKGTNFKGTLLTNAYLESAKYNSKTVLPFGEVFAYRKGMINEDYLLAPRSGGPIVTSKDLEDESPEWIKKNLASERRPSEAFHQRLLTLVRDAREMKTGVIKAVVESAFYTSYGYDILVSSQKPSLSEIDAYQIKNKITDALNLSRFVNEIIALGIKKSEEAPLVEFIELLNGLFPSEMSANNFNSTNSAFALILNRFNDLSKNDLQRLLVLAQKKKAVTATALIADRLSKISKIETASELRNLLLTEVAEENRDQVMMESIGNVKSMTKQELYELLPLAIKTGRDALLLHFLSLAEKISIKDILELSPLAYNVNYDIRFNFLTKLNSLNMVELTTLISIYREKEKNDLISFFVTRTQTISLKDLLSAVKLGNNPRNMRQLILGNLARLSDWNTNEFIQLSSFLLEDERDTFVLFYSNLLTKITTTELGQLLSVAFSKHFDVLDVNITKVSDLSAETLISIGRGYYYGHGDQKDDLFLKALPFVKDLNAKNLETIIYFSSSRKDEIRKLGEELLKSPRV